MSSSSVKIRSSHGCWTCRLRRKKCDERKPVCTICSSLEITCYFGDRKPEWMDGGEKEKKMADDLKTMVKLKASGRRERKWAIGASWADDELHEISPPTSSSQQDQSLAQNIASGLTLDPKTDRDTTEHSSNSADTPATSVTDSESGSSQFPSENWFNGGAQAVDPSLQMSSFIDTFPDDAAERELNFTMMYLDYVFPFLFPFYRPPILEGGRGWLLVLLMKNKALFHTALCLASYFFATVLESIQGAGSHAQCKASNWTELQKQQELSIKSLQRDMLLLNKRGISASYKDSVQCFQSIVQLLSFEVAIANTENWHVHLDAAFVLFSKTIESHATSTTRPWYSILEMMNRRTLEVEVLPRRHPWTSDQAAFRFFTANMLWCDIIASTAQEHGPKMRRFYPELLEGDFPLLRFDDFFGCQNWVLLIIARIAQLVEWKKIQRINGQLSVVELVNRAQVLECELRHGIASLGVTTEDDLLDPAARAPHMPFAPLGVEVLTEIDRLHTTPSVAFHTKIWAHAALTYLAVVVSGYQPAASEIQLNVATTMDLFKGMPSALCLRTLVWPFAVTGCLALPGQDSFFTELVGAMGSMQVFGTVKEALNIMNKVWEHRACIDVDAWDISSCLGVLGHRALLV